MFTINFNEIEEYKDFINYAYILKVLNNKNEVIFNKIVITIKGIEDIKDWCKYQFEKNVYCEIKKI